jgi:hypothetical protein
MAAIAEDEGPHAHPRRSMHATHRRSLEGQRDSGCLLRSGCSAAPSRVSFHRDSLSSDYSSSRNTSNKDVNSSGIWHREDGWEPERAVAEFVLAGGVNKIVVGHQPRGDAPLILQNHDVQVYICKYDCSQCWGIHPGRYVHPYVLMHVTSTHAT